MNNMDTSAEFFNMYVERILQEIGELNKFKLLNETRILFLERNNKGLLDEIEKLNKELTKCKEKVEKKNINKKVTEVNTSENF